MPGANVNVATGTTITFVTSTFTANLMNVNWSGIKRPAIPTTHMGTAAPGAGKLGNASFIPGKDFGSG
jgi:hypothetical protein